MRLIVVVYQIKQKSEHLWTNRLPNKYFDQTDNLDNITLSVQLEKTATNLKTNIWGTLWLSWFIKTLWVAKRYLKFNYKLFSQGDIISISYEIVNIQIMAWCRLATRHYLHQGWPSSVSQYGFIASFGHNELKLF